MKERHWNSIVTSLRHAQCVLVLGPEIPVTTTLPDPTDETVDSTSFVGAFKHSLSRELEEDNRLVHGHTFPAVAQQYEDSEGFGAGALRAAAEKFFKSPLYGPSEVHMTLAALPFTLIITTCHDSLLTKALEKVGKRPIVQRYNFRGDKRENPEFVVPGSPMTPVLFHLFGDATEPPSLVLSENDVLDWLIAIVSERPPLPNSLLRAIKRVGQNFLFLGFGITHWELRVLLKILIRSLELNKGGSAIAAEPLRALMQQDRDEMVFFYQRGTRVEVEDSDVGSFAAELARRLEAEGGFAGEAEPSGPHPHVFISYAREDGDLAARLYDALQKAHFEPWLDRESLVGGEEWSQRIQCEIDVSDFVLVLYTPAFCKKTDSYVNSEVKLARRRALNVRGSCLIPLRTSEVPESERVAELGEYNEMELRPEQFDEDFAKVASTMLREFQRRNR